MILSKLVASITLASAGSLKYISDRKIEGLALGQGFNETGYLDHAHIILVKTQGCGEVCDIFEKSLDGMANDVAEAVETSIGKNITFYKTEIATTGIQDFKKKFGLMRLPTTMFIRGPWIYDYTDNLSAAKLQDFIERHMVKIMEIFPTTDAAHKFIESVSRPEDVRILIETGEAGRQNFELVAGGEVEFAKYGFVSRGEEKNTKGTLTVAKWADDEPSVFEDVDFSNHQTVYNLLMENQLPSISTVDMSKMRYFFMSKKSFLWIVHGDDKTWMDVISPIKDLIDDFDDDFHFLRVDPVSAPEYADFVKDVLRLEWSDSALEEADPTRPYAVVITDLNGPGRFTFPDEIEWNADDLRDWMEKAMHDELPRELQSELIPENDAARVTKTGILKIVADEFEDAIIDASEAHLIIIPTMLCEKDVCEKALQALKAFQEDQKAGENSVHGCGKIRVRMCDGHRNELDSHWGFDMSVSPPAWYIPEKQKVEDVSQLKKVQLTTNSTKSLEDLRTWLAGACAEKTKINTELPKDEL